MPGWKRAAGSPSTHKALWFGAAAVTVGMTAVLAPHLFTSTETMVEQFPDMYSLPRQGLVQLLGPSFLVAGLGLD